MKAIVSIILIAASLGAAGLLVAQRVAYDAAHRPIETTLPRTAEQTTVEAVEDCPFGRCPCMIARIRQTSVPAGWSELIKPKHSAHYCNPAPAGYHAEIFRRQKCVICPEGMQYSGTLKESERIRARANLAEDQCVSIQRTCLDEAR